MKSKNAFRLRTTAAIAMAVAATFSMSAAYAQVAASELSPTAPQEHTVVPGDTLWGISGKFLKSPWKWPDLWALNKDEVKNPHLIYPGQVLSLEVVNGKATLKISAKRAPLGEVRLRPGVRIEDALSDTQSLSTVPLAAVTHFLSRPMLVEPDYFAKSPKILAAETGRLFAGAGSKVYAAGLPIDAKGDFDVYRQGGALINPDDGKAIAFEAVHLGTVRVLRNGETTLLSVVDSNQELTKGDRLVQIVEKPTFNAPVQAAPPGFGARVIKVFDGKSSSLLAESGLDVRAYDREGGPLSIIILNKGTNSHLEQGDVVQVLTNGATVGRSGTLGYIEGKKAADPIKLPDEDNGYAVVFRTFEKISYAIVMRAQRPILAGDRVAAP